jgi:hypothetical protein
MLDALIPTRFLTTLAHLLAVVMLFSSKVRGDAMRVFLGGGGGDGDGALGHSWLAACVFMMRTSLSLCLSRAREVLERAFSLSPSARCGWSRPVGSALRSLKGAPFAEERSVRLLLLTPFVFAAARRIATSKSRCR